MAAPGTVGNLVAPGEDATNRKIRDLARSVEELTPSVLKSILPLITDLQAQQAALAAQQAAILDLIDTQVVFDSRFANTAALSMTAVEQIVASATMPVPAGYTTAVCTVLCSVGVVNPTGSTSSIAARAYIDSPTTGLGWGARRFQSVLAGADGAVYAFMLQEYSGLSGGTFTFSLGMLNTGADWGATPGGGTLEVSVLFTR